MARPPATASADFISPRRDACGALGAISCGTAPAALAPAPAAAAAAALPAPMPAAPGTMIGLVWTASGRLGGRMRSFKAAREAGAARRTVLPRTLLGPGAAEAPACCCENPAMRCIF
jgi:hypothetical protein